MNKVFILVSKRHNPMLHEEIQGHFPICHFLYEDAVEMARQIVSDMLDIFSSKEQYEEVEFDPEITDTDANPLFRIEAKDVGIIEVYQLSIQ